MSLHVLLEGYITPVFSPKGGNMALPHPLALLPHPLILKFILKNNTDWILLTKHHVPLMHSPALNIYSEGNTEYPLYIHVSIMQTSIGYI